MFFFLQNWRFCTQRKFGKGVKGLNQIYRFEYLQITKLLKGPMQLEKRKFAIKVFEFWERSIKRIQTV